MLLLTGRPRIGKTTALRKIISLLGEDNCGGFFTEEVKYNGERTGFKIKTIDGQEGMLADVDSASHLRIGRYGLDIEILENVGIKSVYEALKNKKHLILDEIGPMQLMSESFKQTLLEAACSTKMIIGTIVFESYEWADDFKLHHNVSLFELTMENRDTIVNDIYNMLLMK